MRIYFNLFHFNGDVPILILFQLFNSVIRNTYDFGAPERMYITIAWKWLRLGKNKWKIKSIDTELKWLENESQVWKTLFKFTKWKAIFVSY